MLTATTTGRSGYVTLSEIAVVRLVGAATAAREARRFVRRTLQDAAQGADRLHDIEVCVSELVTNAWEHTDSGRNGEIVVSVAATEATIRITVIDDGGARSKPYVCAEDGTESGRGLRLVAELADRWDSDQCERGTAVWAEF
jgi:anti-sigma regulatory factor (Ser/Thr protein kinase)